MITKLFEETTKEMKQMFPCDDDPATPELAEYTYYKQACQALCFAILEHPVNPALRYFYLTLKKCNDECCQVILKYCWNNNVLTQRERIVIPPENQPECSTISPPLCHFPQGNIIFQGVASCFFQPCE